MKLVTPGPSNYNTSKKIIGDESSVKVPFAMQIRPISAKPGQIKNIVQPGPQDYKTVSTNVFRYIRNVIPAGTFKKEGESREPSRSKERAKTPGPSHYRV